MQWQSMKTAPMDGTAILVTIQASDGKRRGALDAYPYNRDAIAWTRWALSTPYTGTVEELDAEGGDA